MRSQEDSSGVGIRAPESAKPKPSSTPRADAKPPARTSAGCCAPGDEERVGPGWLLLLLLPLACCGGPVLIGALAAAGAAAWGVLGGVLALVLSAATVLLVRRRAARRRASAAAGPGVATRPSGRPIGGALR
jgi:hypothetical protein